MNLYSNEHGLQIKHKENYLFFSLLEALCPEVTSFCRVSGNYQRQVNGFYLEQSHDQLRFQEYSKHCGGCGRSYDTYIHTDGFIVYLHTCLVLQYPGVLETI